MNGTQVFPFTSPKETLDVAIENINDQELKDFVIREIYRKDADIGNLLPSDAYRSYECNKEKLGSDHKQKIEDQIRYLTKKEKQLEFDRTNMTQKEKQIIDQDLFIVKMLKKEYIDALMPGSSKDW